MISLDTSVVVRYLVGTPAAQAGRAASLVDGAAAIAISIVAIVETAHVLRTQYGVARSDVLDVLIDLVTRENVEILGLPKAETLDALVRARSISGSPLPDALIAAAARWAGAVPLYSFDEGLQRLGTAVATP